MTCKNRGGVVWRSEDSLESILLPSFKKRGTKGVRLTNNLKETTND